MGRVGINSKILIGAGVSAVVIILVIAILALEDKPQSSLSTEEINELEQGEKLIGSRSNSIPFYGFESGGNMTVYEEWCTATKGFWEDIGLDKGECVFETRTQHRLAFSILTELLQPTITGKPAQEICRFLALNCPQQASFDGLYQLGSGITFVIYDHKGTEYKFDVSDEDNITFTKNRSQESFHLSENATFEEKFSIQVKTGYDYYTLGEKIAISGIVRDNHHILSQTIFEHPVTIQIIVDGVLVEVAQLDIREDGQFQYIVNTGGIIWKSGEYQIKTTYDIYTATTTFDMGKESRSLLEK